jgi:hypothetical protein
MLTVTLLPLLSLLATQFPMVGNFLFSWIEPAVEPYADLGCGLSISNL